MDSVITGYTHLIPNLQVLPLRPYFQLYEAIYIDVILISFLL